MQEQLNALTKRLRTEKTLREQAQGRAQELSFQVAAGAGAGAGAGHAHGAGGGAVSREPPPANHNSLMSHGRPSQATMFRSQLASGSTGVFARGGAGRKPAGGPP